MLSLYTIFHTLNLSAICINMNTVCKKKGCLTQVLGFLFFWRAREMQREYSLPTHVRRSELIRYSWLSFWFFQSANFYEVRLIQIQIFPQYLQVSHCCYSIWERFMLKCLFKLNDEIFLVCYTSEFPLCIDINYRKWLSSVLSFP